MRMLAFDRVNYTQSSKTSLKNASFSINAGEIQVILGDQNSGKSIIPLILSGRVKPTSGQIEYKKQKYKSFSIVGAKQKAIEVCTVSLNLVESLSIEKNFFIGCKNRKLLQLYNKSTYRKNVTAFLEQFDFNLKADQKVGELDNSQKAVVKLLQCIFYKPRSARHRRTVCIIFSRRQAKGFPDIEAAPQRWMYNSFSNAEFRRPARGRQ